MLDKKYYDYLKGKSVAIIGPAAYLTQLKTGPDRDSFDVVVRINRGTELTNLYAESIGTRTDILYNCLIKSPDNGGDLDTVKFQSAGVEWISTIPNSDINGFSRSNRLHKMVSRFTVFKLKRKFNFHIMDFRDYSKINKRVDCRANTGFAAIFDLLNHDISKLYITGYSFYLDSFMSGYKKGCDRDEEEFARQCHISERHKQKPQWQYLKSLRQADPRIEVDPVLNQILNMNDLSRDFDLSHTIPA